MHPWSSFTVAFSSIWFSIRCSDCWSSPLEKPWSFFFDCIVLFFCGESQMKTWFLWSVVVFNSIILVWCESHKKEKKICSAWFLDIRIYHLIFEKSLKDGILPNCWKEATVIAIHKKGSKRDVRNYRQVSLTSVICKMLEVIIKNHIL